MQTRNLLHRFIRSRPHLSLAIALGFAVALGLPAPMPLITRALIGWNCAVWPYLLTMAWVMTRADHVRVRLIAASQDESAGLVLVTLSIAAAISLTAIVVELGRLGGIPGNERALRYGFTALTVFGSWFLVGTLFCFHYAHLFYRLPVGPPPLEFPGAVPSPDYWDFLYFAFTIAVAAQTADVLIMTRGMRKIVLGQAILSFFFNITILGLSVNIAAGLINS